MGCVNVEVTPLPGIGVRKDFALRGGRRIGVISLRDGSIELIVSKADDPDASLARLPRLDLSSNGLISLYDYRLGYGCGYFRLHERSVTIKRLGYFMWLL